MINILYEYMHKFRPETNRLVLDDRYKYSEEELKAGREVARYAFDAIYTYQCCFTQRQQIDLGTATCMMGYPAEDLFKSVLKLRKLFQSPDITT